MKSVSPNEKRLEKKLIRKLQKASSTREFKFLALDLIETDFNIMVLAGLAQPNKVRAKLGYLAELTAKACENTGLEQSPKLYHLAGLLYHDHLSWQHLNPFMPDFGKRIISRNPQTRFNQKWKIYSTLIPEQLQEWISLYKIGHSKYAGSKQATR